MRYYFVFLALVGAAALTACGSDTSADDASLNGCSAATAQTALNITVQDYAFVPTCVKVAAGSSLTFQNRGAVSHTVTSDTGMPNTFDNTAFDPNASVTVPFANKGATGVHCSYHSQMKMTVIVE